MPIHPALWEARSHHTNRNLWYAYAPPSLGQEGRAPSIGLEKKGVEKRCLSTPSRRMKISAHGAVLVLNQRLVAAYDSTATTVTASGSLTEECHLAFASPSPSASHQTW